MLWGSSNSFFARLVKDFKKLLAVLNPASHIILPVVPRDCSFCCDHNRWHESRVIRTSRCNRSYNFFQTYWMCSICYFSQAPPMFRKLNDLITGNVVPSSKMSGQYCLCVAEYYWLPELYQNTREVRTIFPSPSSLKEGTAFFIVKISWKLWEPRHLYHFSGISKVNGLQYIEMSSREF